MTVLRQHLFRMCVALSLFAVQAMPSASAGELSEYRRISSDYLGYDLQYRVYRPDGASSSARLPTLYVTDGEYYLRYGDFKSVLDRVIGSGSSVPIVVVFVDSRDPDAPDLTRRNQEFMCNTRYAQFFAGELIPRISAEEPVSMARDERVVMGFSFGGINAACFGIALPNLFSGIAMQSPGSADHIGVIRSLYAERERLPLRMFLSVGTNRDNLPAAKRFVKTLKKKGYDVTYVQVDQGHDWQNWGPLIDDVLVTFFAKKEPQQ